MTPLHIVNSSLRPFYFVGILPILTKTEQYICWELHATLMRMEGPSKHVKRRPCVAGLGSAVACAWISQQVSWLAPKLPVCCGTLAL